MNSGGLHSLSRFVVPNHFLINAILIAEVMLISVIISKLRYIFEAQK
jgi:hypothetical protein